MRRVEKTDTCWLWTGAQTGAGYGDLGRPVGLAHRLSYTLHHGPIPDGMLICHTCDVRNCVNPDHLWAGTQSQNMVDMYAKGRRR